LQRWLRPASLLLAYATSACASAPRASEGSSATALEAFADTLQPNTFRWFWETTNPRNGLTPDRTPDPPFASIASVGFGLTAWPVGVERGWITRDQARARTLATLRFFWTAPQGPDSAGVSGYKGFFYHFLDMDTGLRFRTTELSTIDSALLLAGILTAQSYFDGPDRDEAAIRAYADSIYLRVDWNWFIDDSTRITMGYRPGQGFGPGRWRGFNEGLILHVLALASPTHPISPATYDTWLSTYRWGEFHGQEHVNFAPLFGHQYSHVWIDFRGIRDRYMRERGIDYFENSRRATLSQKAYADANPMGWRGYGGDFWGLTASDGPNDTTLVIDGRERRFHRYWARGAATTEIRDDGTLVPTAAGGSVPFAPEIALRALHAMRMRYGANLFTEYGFLDAFNPTLREPIRLTRGTIVPGVGWFDDNYLGIDQGPILLMIENHRTELVWTLMRKNPHIVRGLCRAGFTGGWLEGRCG
jgi:hypothetical protein